MYRFQREDDMTIYSLMEESNTSSTKPKQASKHVAGFTGVNKLNYQCLASPLSAIICNGAQAKSKTANRETEAKEN